MKIRVLQILDTLNMGSGVASVVLSYYRSIEKIQDSGSRIVFDFMVNEEVEKEIKDELERNGSKVFLMPPLQIKYYWSYKQELRKFFKEHKEYQIVHGHVPNAAAFYLRAAKKAGVPVRIIHSHNSQGADRVWKQIRNRILSKIGIWYANQYMACGEKAARYLYGKDSSNVSLLNNVVDTKRFCYKEEVRQKIRAEMDVTEKFVMGHVGRFCYQKNQKFLIRVLAEICKREPDVCLLLIGEGEERKEVERLIEELHLKKAVKLLGVLSNVEDYMQAMDVFLLPSRYEGVPVSILEAQATGLPCVISDGVTREMETEYTDYIELSQTVEKWSDTILHWRGKERCGYLPDQFDSAKESIRLFKKYKTYQMGCQKR